jgi:uncharacterized protein YgiM (DUF1202 family)
MRIATSYLLATFIVVQNLSHPIYGESPNSENVYETPEPPQEIKQEKPFIAFTGKTLKNKVRVRLQPTLDAKILREINKGEIFIVVGETDDFYAIEAPADIKGYVFRTYVLDNIVEGSRVNVRLEPNLDAPIIAQLHTGDKIEGQVSEANNKWLEITPPSSTRFYVSKDFVEKIGDSNMKLVLDTKAEEGKRLLNSTDAVSQAELKKNWNQINLDGINDNLNKIANNYPEFPDLQSRAKALQQSIQETYLKKKMDYLEGLAKNADFIEAQNKELASKIAEQQAATQATPQAVTGLPPAAPSSASVLSATDRMNGWLPVENRAYETWAEMNDNQPISAFYDDETQHAVELKGIVQPYDRVVRNRPGDYVLLNPVTRIPTAYLYSTRVNLQELVGHNVTLKTAPRDNNNFAYPAYFVLSAD